MVSLVEPFTKEGYYSVRRQSPNARLEVSKAALDGGASLWQMVRHAHHPEPVEGGRLGGILQMNVFIILRPLIGVSHED